MRNAIDTFLRFLYDNLSPDITVHAFRKDPDSVASENLQMNAINVGFGRVTLEVLVSSIIFKIDIVSDTQLSAVDITQTLWDLLNKKMYTPVLDYTDPTNPVDTGTTLMWKKVSFTPISSDAYFQYSCTLLAQFHTT